MSYLPLLIIGAFVGVTAIVTCFAYDISVCGFIFAQVYRLWNKIVERNIDGCDAAALYRNCLAGFQGAFLSAVVGGYHCNAQR